MKKLSRRALGLLLSVLMLVSLFPVSAFAEEAAGDEHVQPLVGTVETETVMPVAEAAQPEPAEELKADYTYINPLYQGLISEDQLRKPEEGSDSQTYSLEAGAEYTSDEALVVQQLRNELKQRSETIQLLYIMEGSADEETFKSELKLQSQSFWQQALAHTGVVTEGDYIAYQYGGYNGNMSAYKSDGLYYVTFNYTVTYYTTAEQESEMDTAAASVIATLALDGKSDYEKLAAIYGYICDNVTYDYANLEDSTYLLKYTAYAALINKTAVCQGYAVLLYRLALMAGVDARVIAGIGGGGNHAWNIARIGSLYYDLDSTWDAGKSSSSYNYFLRCEANFTNHTRNEEFTTAEFNSAYPMADADYVPGSESEETVSGSCGENLTWVLDGGTLTVSGAGAMDEYSVGEAPWYAHREEIRKLVIDSGVTTISGFVFDSCTSLTEVYLPLSLEEIGMNAFQNCGPVDLYYAGDLEGWLGLTVSWNALTYGGFNLFLDGVLLTELNVPADVTTIGSFAFAGCLSLTGVTMAEGVTGVADWAFSHCDNLTDISFATSIETIGNFAFCDCPSLVNVSLPANAAYGDGVFEECSGLTSISLPENMTSITDSMFMDCTSLAEITIPASVTAIESYAFYNCGMLTDVYYGGSEAQWSSITVGENNDPLLSATIHYSEEEGVLTPDENGNYHITSFAELKALSAMTFENTAWIYYEGNEALVFEEDLTLPESIMLVSAADVRIPSGVTVTMQCDFSGWGRTLYVEGTLIAYGSIGVQDINVSGRLESHSSISLTSNSVITGEENISFVQNEANGISGFSISYNVDSYEGLKEAVQEANTNKPNRSYSIHLRTESTVTIEEELSLGKNTELNVNCPLVIAESGKMSIQGWMYVYTPVTVNGSLDNSNRIIIHHSVSPTASITLGETGNYSGTGIIAIYTQTLTSPEEALPGFDLTDFDVVSSGSGWSIYYAAEMEKLTTPVDLLYGYRYNFTYDENGEVSGYETVEAPGMLSWRVDGLTQEQFVIEIYKDDGETPIASALWFFGDFYSGNRIYSIDEFIRMDPESGEYHFTVKSTGDYTKYSSSDVAVSETWTYVKPELSLGDCTRPVVDGQNVSFLLPEDLTYVGGSEVEIYYSVTPDMSEGICCGASWFLDNHALSQREAASYIYDDAIQSNGSGYYAVRVRALSWDINSACNGSWSELSEPCYIGDTVGEVDSILQDIEEGTVEPTPENVRGLVQQNNTEDLKKAMLADGDDNGVNSSLQALEAYTGGTVVQVSDSMAGRFSQEQVSVIGASLNNVQNGEKPVKLIVDQAKEDDVIPEVFDNTVAVRFSLELENVDSTQLDVPVKITLPVPDGVNPEFLVILHYHVTGEEPEEIWPHVFQQDGQYYASFVLTSFSDFVMTMPAEQGTECQHEWDDGKVTAEPGCETTGIRTYTCKLCGETRTEGITAKGHSQDDGKITTEPGCETEGVKTYSCTVCGKELKTETIAAKGHSQDDGKITTEPGCVTEGVKTYSCTVCGKELKTEPVPAAGHSWDEGKITTLPTAAKEGEKVYTCTVCGETRTEVIPALKVDGELSLSPTLSKDLSLMRVELKNVGVYVDGVKIGVWSTRQGKSTLKWFEAENKDGVWTVNVPLCAFYLCTADVFQVEAYGVNAAKSELLAQTKVDIVAAPTHVYSSESDATCNSCGRVRKTDLSGVKTTPMYRLYNPFTGEHFYTGSTEERDTLSAIGWKYEGVAWNAPVSGGTPVHRVCNPNSGDHHYTTDMAEVLMLLNAGWQYENICWNSAFSDAVPQYRLWNRNADLGSHHYTSSTEERQILVDAGWIYEGIGWYGMKN